MASGAGRQDEAGELFERSIELFESEQRSHPAARVSARLPKEIWDRGRLSEAVERMDRSFKILSKEEPDSDLATLAAQLGRLLFFSGDAEVAAERIEVALEIAETQGLPETLSQALITKSIILISRARRLEALALLRYALDVALEHEIPSAALRAYYNLADAGIRADAYQEAVDSVTKGLAVARRVGNRYWEWQFLGQVYPFEALGMWDEVLEMTRALPPIAVEGWRRTRSSGLFRSSTSTAATSKLPPRHGRCSTALRTPRISRSAPRVDTKRPSRPRKRRSRGMMGIGHEAVKDAFVEGIEAALAVGRLDDAEEMLTTVEELPPGRLPQYVEAHARRFRSRIAMIGHGAPPSIEQGLKNAAGMFREMAVPFWMAVTLLEHGEWLIQQDRGAESKPFLDEAREVFDHLEAAPWLARLARATGDRAEAVSS